MYRPKTAVPGGLDVRAMIDAIEADAENPNKLNIHWTTPVVGKDARIQRATNLGPGNWQTVQTVTSSSDPTGQNITSVDKQGDVEFYQIVGPTPSFVGALVCAGCHAEAHADWSNTHHAKALDTLIAIRQDNNAYCLKCHTVGYGLPNGFISTAQTPKMGGVQCESCHGPSGQHVANPNDLSVRPKITIAAEVCGGCHTGFHNPTYTEWLQAGHSHVSEPGMFNAGVNRMFQCGTCHSGAVRAAVVKDYDNGGMGLNVVPPTVSDANYYGQTCSTCHDPHKRFDDTLPGLDMLSRPAQLRNPIGSAKFMSFATSTSPTNFAAQYDPDIQICGQCHNERGATWANSTARPPHHSPQYNILIGQAVDPLNDTNTLNGALVRFNTMPSGHGDPTTLAPFGNPAQCTTCHNRADHVQSPSPATPNYTGHTFQVQLLACADCHGFLDDPMAEEIAEGGVEFIQAGIRDGIGKALTDLDTWAATMIPGLYEPGTTNYIAFNGTNNPANVVAWEFTTIGQLNPGKRGPSAAAQNRIPAEIKQSRFLLYLVEHDASYGVHNPPYARYLLKTAQELAKAAPPVPAE
jgi:hypothetical protein